MATSDEKIMSLLRFLGFGGLAAVLGLAVVVGKYQEDIDANTRNINRIVDHLEKGQEKLTQTLNAVSAQQQQVSDMADQVSDINHRVEILETSHVH